MSHEIQPPPEDNPKPVAHIYTFAITWVVVATVLPIVDIYDFIATVIISGMIALPVYAVAWVVYSMRTGSNLTRKKIQSATVPKPYYEPQVTAPSSIDDNGDESIINEAMTLLRQMDSTKNRIFNGEVVGNSSEIISTSRKIIEKIRRKPEVFNAANSFFTYYLPTTAKLIENYYHLESQDIGSGNIANTMQKIEETLETLKNAYKEQLDALFSDTASDLATDINVLETFLKLDGFVELVDIESIEKAQDMQNRLN